MGYRIPDRYVTVSITLQAKNPNEVAQKITEEFKREGYSFRTGFRSSSVWDVSFDTSTALRKLGKFGPLANFVSAGHEVAHPELYFKRDHLRKDTAAAYKVLEQVPAIKGLILAELKTLDKFIAEQEHATGGIILAVDVQGTEETDQLMPYGVGGPERNTRRSMRALKVARHSGLPRWFQPSGDAEEEYWERTPTPSGCAAFASNCLHVILKSGKVDRPRVAALFKDFGAVDGPAACRGLLGADPRWLTDSGIRDLQKTVASQTVSWEFRALPGAEAELLTHLNEKRVALENDLRRFEGDLASARSIIALTRAEIARLKFPENPDTRGRTPVVVDFQN